MDYSNFVRNFTKIFWILVLSTLSSFAFSADVGTHGNSLQDYQLTAGLFHTCVIDDNGVQCWGRSNDGQSTVTILWNSPYKTI